MTSQDVILGLLSKRSLSGYEIKNLFLKLISHFYDASYGTIYPTLGKMEQDGLISTRSPRKAWKNSALISKATSSRTCCARIS